MGGKRFSRNVKGDHVRFRENAKNGEELDRQDVVTSDHALLSSFSDVFGRAGTGGRRRPPLHGAVEGLYDPLTEAIPSRQGPVRMSPRTETWISLRTVIIISRGDKDHWESPHQ